MSDNNQSYEQGVYPNIALLTVPFDFDTIRRHQNDYSSHLHIFTKRRSEGLNIYLIA